MRGWMMARSLGALLAGTTALLGPALAQAPAGPYNVETIGGGIGLTKTIAPVASAGWTVHFWAKIIAPERGLVRLAGLGSADQGQFAALRNGRPALLVGSRALVGRLSLQPGQWHFFAIRSDGQTTTLAVDGHETARTTALTPTTAGLLQIAPREAGQPGFGGRIAGLTVERSALDRTALDSARASTPDEALIAFEEASPHWPVQVHQMPGQVTPQDAWTLPKSATPADAPRAKPDAPRPAIEQRADGHWTIQGWRLSAAPAVRGDGVALSSPGAATPGWYDATVPGTVLTTLVDRGVYPDPARGLNNLAIPEQLAHQDYWYRSEFDLPPAAQGRHLELLLNGVNYAADVWVNGANLGSMKGAFIRGSFDVSAAIHPGRNAIAVRVSPPPHPGHSQEESLTAGVGENGGMMMLDGPTFGASEGWDWIPTIRDRNTGLWQGVDLIARGDVRIGDAQIVTSLPKPDNSIADIAIDVPVTNLAAHAVSATIKAAFDDVAVERTITLAAGETQTVSFSPLTDVALAVRQPRLWWPNGYGDPVLHMLHLAASGNGAPSDSKDVRFGMRQVTYDLSLVDDAGELRRVDVDLTKARALGRPIVDVRHEAIRQVPGGWAYSLAKGTETSAAVTPAGDESLSPFLVIRVNGVRIAAKGGAVGMDDFMKRVDRPRLEPFFQLQKDAHLNVVRNWIGQDSEENFYDLADEYGLMVLNDFWESTQDYNIEAQDVPLFLKNADDVIKRFRNHPSIIMWFGRNEGVPQPILNEGLDDLVRKDDGTRLYMGSSNRINLHDSGPYSWRPPVQYFTELSNGFAVEVGTPSFPTLESWQRAIPASELWPISDSWAYHDWHQTGNGDVHSFQDAMTREFGVATSFPDFERKAQMLEYESYRAIFEGLNAGLWTRNSGRLLWMTQPAWPSSHWQIFSSDYDTHGAFYGVKKASEPIHIQMNLPDHKVILVNSSREAADGITVHAKVESLTGEVLFDRTVMTHAGAGQLADVLTLDLDPLMAHGPVLVRLEARAGGRLVSDNFYWQSRTDDDLRAMTALPDATLRAGATAAVDGKDRVLTVTITNPGPTAAIETKLTLFDANGLQVLPATFSDNYVSLLPGETRSVEIRAPQALTGAAPVVRLRGFNVTPLSIALSGARP